MNENTFMPAAAGAVYWRDPAIDAPPQGAKLLLLTSGGVAVVGQWMSDSNIEMWSPLPKKART